MTKSTGRAFSLRTASIALAVALLASIAPGLSHGQVHTAQAQSLPATLVNCTVNTASLALAGEEQAILDETNTYRTAAGLPVLRVSYALTVAALWKSTDMAVNHYGTHDDSFRTWDQRFRDCGYSIANAWMGENIAGGNASGDATLQQWVNSPHHNENLLGEKFTAVGIKRVKSADPKDTYGWYWSMELASDLDVDLSVALQQGQ